MGIGLEAGLTVDAMADELARLLDRADEAALSGDIRKLVDALGALGERLLFMRPFIPERRTRCQPIGRPFFAVGCPARRFPRSGRRTCGWSKRPSPIALSGH
jgi:hypothetical protein